MNGKSVTNFFVKSLLSHIRRDSFCKVPYRDEMEAFFGLKFENVCSFVGKASKAACEALNVNAFTVKNTIVFKDPSPSRELVAHELTHVIQQRPLIERCWNGNLPSTAFSSTMGELEAEAEEAAFAFGSGRCFDGAITPAGKNVRVQFRDDHPIPPPRAIRTRRWGRGQHGRAVRSAERLRRIQQQYYLENPVTFFSFEDTARYIVREMRTNTRGDTAAQIRREMQSSDTMDSALGRWALQVRRGGPWDHKDYIQNQWYNWTLDSSNRRLYFFDIWSNIHYGYVGRSVGIGIDLLLGGAGAAQVLDGTSDREGIESALWAGARGDIREFWSSLRSLDDRFDQNAICLGVLLHHNVPDPRNLDVSQVVGLLRRFSLFVNSIDRSAYRNVPWWALNRPDRNRWHRDVPEDTREPPPALYP